MLVQVIEYSNSPVVQAVLIIAATLVLEDLAIIATGVIIVEGGLGVTFGFSALLVGVILGDIALYVLGRSPLAVWAAKKISRVGQRQWLERHMKENLFKLLLTARCLPGLRLPVFFAAGLSNIDYKRFSIIVSSLATLWVALLLTFSIQLQRFGDAYLGRLRFLVVGLIVAVWVFASLISRLRGSTRQVDLL